MPVDVQSQVVHRYVFELRYDFGYVYLDRCGEVINRILRAHERFEHVSATPNSGHLVAPASNLVFNFGPDKLDLSQSQTESVDTVLPEKDFARLADEMATKVYQTLELSEFSRIGFRAWYLFPTDTKEASFRAIRELQHFSINPGIIEQLGEAKDTSYTAVIDRPSHQLRIAVTPFEQHINLSPGIILAARQNPRLQSADQKRTFIEKHKAQKRIKNLPPFGVLVDLDASMEEPPLPDDLTVEDFILKGVQDFTHVVPLVLQTREDDDADK